jgi:hypothetical protein
MPADLSTRGAPGQLATAAPIESFQILDHIAGGLVAPRQQQPTLGTISAGYMGQSSKGYGYPTPVVSRDGTIYINGKQNLQAAFETVPGLATALQAGSRKRLTIAFPFDDPALFIQQRFARYSTTALELYGDQHGLTRIRAAAVPGSGRVVHEHLAPDSDEFTQAMEFVKTQTSVYFLLAEWKDGVARVVMPDGVGLYRLRMTSRNSINGIVNSLRWISKLTGGRIAGVPFDLFLENHDVVGPDGKRRDVPVWQLVMKPPKAIELTTANFQQVMADALEQGQRLRVLPAPSETVELAALEAPDIDLDVGDVNERSEPEPPLTPRTIAQRDLDLLARGGLCDPARQRMMFFRSFNHTELRDKATRADVIHQFTNGRVASLRDYLADASESEARALFVHCAAWAERQNQPTAPESPVEPPALIDTETGEIHEPADDPWIDDDPLATARDERNRLMDGLTAKLDEAAAIGLEVEELDLAELTNAELASVVNGLAGKLASHKAEQGGKR